MEGLPKEPTKEEIYNSGAKTYADGFDKWREDKKSEVGSDNIELKPSVQNQYDEAFPERSKAEAALANSELKPTARNQYDQAFPERSKAEAIATPAVQIENVPPTLQTPIENPEEKRPLKGGGEITKSEFDKLRADFIEKYTPKAPEPKPVTLKSETQPSPTEKLADIDAGIKKLADQMKTLDPNGPDYRRAEEQWNLLRREQLSSSQSKETAEVKKPIEERVTELKEKIAIETPKREAPNAATLEFLAMLKDPHAPYEKASKTSKNESKFWDKIKENWNKGKEWIKHPSWIKERLKGFATAGLWEVWQGAKFQISARKTGKEMVKANEKLQENRGMFTYDEAFAVHKKIVESGKLETVDREKFEEYANTFRKEKNQPYIDLVTAQARAKIKERLNWGGVKFLEYRDKDGNKVQFDDAKLDKMMGDLRSKLVGMQDETVVADIKDYSGIIKKDLDPKYWKHYQYAGVDAAIWSLGYAGYSHLSGTGGGESLATPTGGIESATPPATGMDGTIWNTADQAMQNPPAEMGLEPIPDPSQAQLIEASKLLSKGNGVGVELWNMKGTPMDTLMQQGHPLDMSSLYDNWDKIVKLGGK